DAPRPHDGICPICLRKKRLVADHDHTTGRFRGMICIKCNTPIGWIELTVVKQNLPRYLRGEMADAPCGERTDLARAGAAETEKRPAVRDGTVWPRRGQMVFPDPCGGPDPRRDGHPCHP